MNIKTIFDLPPSAWAQHQLKCLDAAALENQDAPLADVTSAEHEDGLGCQVCGLSFDSVDDQRAHFHSRQHLHYLRQSLDAYDDGERDRSDDSSDTDSSASGDDLAEDVRASLTIGSSTPEIPRSGRQPTVEFLWQRDRDKPLAFSVYRAILDAATEPVESLSRRIREPGQWLFVFLTAGRFNAAIISSKTGAVVRERAIQRYVTRRKQGGAQSAHDQSSGRLAKSAGAGLRRANAQKLQQEVQETLADWRDAVAACELWFVYAPGRNRQLLFSSPETSSMAPRDARIRSFPFSPRRSSHEETLRCFRRLVQISIGEPTAAPAVTVAPAAAPPRRVTTPKAAAPAPDARETAFASLLRLLKRRKTAAVLNKVRADTAQDSKEADHVAVNFKSQQCEMYPTLLHAAALFGQPALVLALLREPLRADPTIPNVRGQTAYQLSRDRATRDSFRRVMGEHSDWWSGWISTARVPSALIVKEPADSLPSASPPQKSKTSAKRDPKGPSGDGNATTPIVAGVQIGGSGLLSSRSRFAAPVLLTPEQERAIERQKRLAAIERRMKQG